MEWYNILLIIMHSSCYSCGLAFCALLPRMTVKTFYKEVDVLHFKRRQQILEKHPEIRQLMTIDPSFKFVAGACALTQFLVAFELQNAEPLLLLLFTVFVGPCFCNAITNSLHETVHDLAIYGSPLANKFFGGFVNLSLAWPVIGGYYRTHRNHHAFLGSDLDAKYPSIEEAKKYDYSYWGRIKFIFQHPFQGGERWTKNIDEPPSDFAIWNFRTVWLCNALVFYFCGLKSFLYLILSCYINDCIFIQGSKNFADHRVDETQAFSKSYYGWINYFDFNIGYHREHHDFPMVASRYFPEIRRIAKEFYSDPKFIETSLFTAVWRMLTAPWGEGLTVHANKLTVKQVALKDDMTKTS